MTHFEWTSLALTVIAIILIPAVVIMIRGAIKWTRTEDRLGELVRDVRELVESKDRVHTEMYAQMREDRAATDRRLRYLEEWFMGKGTRRAR